MTEPLTPADCDLRGFAFMPLDVSRLRDSDLTAEATGDEFRAAVLLWCAAWHQVPAASLPNDDKVIAHLAGYGRAPKEWKKIRDGALHGFVECEDGRLYHPHVADKANEAWQSRGRFAEKREQDRERLRKWRETKRDRNTDGNEGETRFETSTKPLREGQGTGDSIQLANANCASGEKSPGQPTDADKAFWDNAKGYLGPSRASMIGKWVKAHGKPATAQAITAAQLERAVDPIPYIERTLRNSQARDEELPIC